MHSTATAAGRRPVGWLARATISGFIALGVSTVSLVIVSGVAGALGEGYRGSGLLFDWMYELTHNPLVELGRGSVFGSLALHLTFGMFWAVLYALVFEPRLRQYPGWQAGAIFSLLPFFLSVVVFLPLTGAGLFGSALGAGPLPLIGNLVLHLLYGATLGAGYSAGGDLAETADDAEVETIRQTRTMGRAETSAARGILIGLCAGGLVGVIMGSILPFSSVEQVFRSWPLAMGVGGALAGGAVGALIGSMAGLTEPAEAVRPDELPTEGEPVSALLVPLGVIAMVATIIVSIGSLLLTVADFAHSNPRDGYDRAIATGLAILALVSGVSAVIARGGHDHRGDHI